MRNQIQSSALLVLLLFSTLFSFSQVPIYNSYPSATPVIYLDFDGQTVSGTSWNVTGPIFCGASGLTNAQIAEIFNRVAEDYRPFTINVTTDSTKYFSAPANQRTRVIVTVTSDWYGSAGGVSFVNSFTWGDDTPCFVFSALLNYNTKNVAEAISHEAGHTLGLRHQSSYDANCIKTAEYNSGSGTGETSWAPIMGVGYSRNLTTWYNGQSTLGCNIYQNDLDVITSAANGVTYRTDYKPTTFTNAPSQSFTNNQFITNSIIVKNTDQDLFKFTMPSLKIFQLSAVPFNVGSGNAGANLDMKVTLYNSAQTLLNTYSSVSSLSVLIDTILNAGTYYFKIEGVGNNYAPDYAITGSYSVQGEITQATLPVQKLELQGSSSKDRHLLNWTIEADEKITEQIIESSTDGKNFTPLVQPDNDSRSYSYIPEKQGSVIYRLHVLFDDNSSNYSNTILLKSANIERPKLVNSLVTNAEIIVTSPSTYDFTLIDLNGKILNKGKLSSGTNTISVSGLINGMYLVRFSDGRQQWTEKLVKQ
jgi:Secretion system C-terminal sorting domain/Dual-action HEIGH metallo-peptidase